MADAILLAAIAFFGTAALLSFLRHAYNSAPMPILLDRRLRSSAFLGSITAMLAMGAGLLFWRALLDYP